MYIDNNKIIEDTKFNEYCDTIRDHYFDELCARDKMIYDQKHKIQSLKGWLIFVSYVSLLIILLLTSIIFGQ